MISAAGASATVGGPGRTASGAVAMHPANTNDPHKPIHLTALFIHEFCRRFLAFRHGPEIATLFYYRK
ncbi:MULTISPECIES: hypothetical protein [unclassified Variovorax]|uniref:hypothetical protein n=1 Tax=unclassified Variovorax TaxID=663243 RepID=UPI00131BE2CA|nr:MULTISPECIES: hypothetical protein [unclassified Variovorax]QRY29751.1 hypothetical protein JVX96_16690 [Variovorax sp. PDNC026]